MKILSVDDVAAIVHRHGFDNYLKDLLTALKCEYARWDEFTRMPRPAMHVRDGVLELMPVCDTEYYTFKYVNCHPKNPQQGKMTVVATGQLSRVDTGYPLMFSEMTLLTALRTAATSALATDLMARDNAETLAIIGTGAQSEFQVRAMRLVRNIREVRYFDIDAAAMLKFERNMRDTGLTLSPCVSAEQAVKGADIVTVCTACKQHVDVIKDEWVVVGMHINALGGDCPGKTELELSILDRTRTVVEYFEQSYVEGEIQRLSKTEAKRHVYAELHELVRGRKKVRQAQSDITLFDSVGIALEDYAALRVTYELANLYSIGKDLCVTPDVTDPKDLVSLLSQHIVH